jgi:hypothetical protein
MIKAKVAAASADRQALDALSIVDTTSTVAVHLADPEHAHLTAAEKTVLTGVQADQVRKITVSTNDPSGGNDGDIWIKYTP